MRVLTGKIRVLDDSPLCPGLQQAHTRKGKCTRDVSENEVVTVKVLRSTPETPQALAALKRKMTRKGEVWSTLNHPNIAPFLGVSYDADRPGVPCLVRPYYAHGDVTAYLREHPSADRLRLIAQVAAGLAHLHGPDIRIVHENIKASNILINNQEEACLVDFGLVSVVEPKSKAITSRWSAYELVISESDDCKPPQTFATDVWAFAMTALEIFTDRVPFCLHDSEDIVHEYISQGGRPQHRTYPEISSETWAILIRCWDTDPSRRPPMHALSLVFNVLDALRPQTLSDSNAHAVLESADGMQLRRANAKGGNPALNGAGGLLPQKRRSTLPQQSHLPPPRRAYSILHGALSDGNGERAHKRSKLIAAPYGCHWPACSAQFSVLRECQLHELRHVVLEKGCLLE